MSLTLDFSADPGIVWDNQETIKLTSVGRSDVPVQTIDTAIKQTLTLRELAASNGVYTSQDVKWFLAGVLLTFANPRPADTITDARGDVWTILDTAWEDMDQVWELTTRNFVLAEGLRDTLAIFSPFNVQDAAAARTTPAWIPKYTGIQAKFQETGGELADQWGGRGLKRTFQCFVGTRVIVGPGDRLQDQNGNIYEYVSHESPDRIDQLQVIVCESGPFEEE